MVSNSFAERLANIFRERDITQQEAAQKVGVSRQAIARWLNGSSEPERDKIVALAEFLRLPPAYLMFGENGAFDSVELNDNMISIPVLYVQGGCWPAEREKGSISQRSSNKADEYPYKKSTNRKIKNPVIGQLNIVFFKTVLLISFKNFH